MTIIDIQDISLNFYGFRNGWELSLRGFQLKIGDRCYLEDKIRAILPYNVPLTESTNLWMCGTGTGYCSLSCYATDRQYNVRTM